MRRFAFGDLNHSLFENLPAVHHIIDEVPRDSVRPFAIYQRP